MSALSYGSDVNARDTFSLRFDACTREPDSWKAELYATARSIAEKTQRPIWIASSGGVDSEVACRAFFDQNIDFSVLTLEHVEGTNRHDIHYAVKWCRERSVPQKIIPFDATHFLTNGFKKYVDAWPAIHPFRYLQFDILEIIEEMGGYGVLCSGEQLYQADMNKKQLSRADMYLPLSNGTVLPLAWCAKQAIDHEPYFHFGTPELVLSYMRLPLVAFALENPDAVFRHEANAYTLKRLAYQSVWTDIEVRYKSHGFEKMRPLYDEAKQFLRKECNDRYIPYNIPVIEVEAQLTGHAHV